MRIAIVKEFNTFYRLIITFIKRTEEHYKLIHSDILRHIGASTTTDDAPKSHSIFSNLPSGFLTKLCHRITSRLRTFLSGDFNLHRGWTIFTVMLYSLFVILVLSNRLTIKVF